MKQSKLISLIAILSLSFAFLSGCAQKTEEDKAIEATESAAKQSIDKAKELQAEAEKKAAELEKAAKQ